MKLMSYRQGNKATYGAVIDDVVVDLGALLTYPDLRSVLEANALEEARNALKDQSGDMSLDEITFLPVIPNPDKIICVGLNYEDHRIETGQEKTEYPVLFTRFSNTQTGHAQAMIRPKVSDKFDYECELAVIIGKRGRHISEKDAFAHVAGYACYNDGSVRDWQFHTSQFVPGKNFPATGGFGPWMVTTDEIPDPSTLSILTRLNDVEVQRSTTDQLIFPVPKLIAYLSTFTELVAGDVISTGTPGGVGARREPPLFMKPGDVVEVEIPGIGVLRNPIVRE